MNSYILFRRNSVFKGLNFEAQFWVENLKGRPPGRPRRRLEDG
jgi:hypothetical protein